MDLLARVSSDDLISWWQREDYPPAIKACAVGVGVTTLFAVIANRCRAVERRLIILSSLDQYRVSMP